MHTGISGRQGTCESASDLHEMPEDALAYVVGKMDVRQRFLYSLTGRTAWRFSTTPSSGVRSISPRAGRQSRSGRGRQCKREWEGRVGAFFLRLKRMWGLGSSCLTDAAVDRILSSAVEIQSLVLRPPASPPHLSWKLVQVLRLNCTRAATLHRSRGERSPRHSDQKVQLLACISICIQYICSIN
jgi:hypothetical protein